MHFAMLSRLLFEGLDLNQPNKLLFSSVYITVSQFPFILTQTPAHTSNEFRSFIMVVISQPQSLNITGFVGLEASCVLDNNLRKPCSVEYYSTAVTPRSRDQSDLLIILSKVDVGHNDCLIIERFNKAHKTNIASSASLFSVLLLNSCYFCSLSCVDAMH